MINRITGAKNVLLLIVSGKEEITIDEIGLINDYIQEKAGHGANIIMGSRGGFEFRKLDFCYSNRYRF